MATFLFDDIIFGPVKSRRLGNSLGINLLPVNKKICNFNCVYCECGLSYSSSVEHLPGKDEILERLEKKLAQLKAEDNIPDSITYAGNGEPTMHPDFYQIISGTVELRNKYFPNSIISVLTNASLIHLQQVRDALDLANQNIIKLDSAFKETVDIINCPENNFNLDEFIANAKKFRQKPVIQTLFLRGTINQRELDNLTEYEINNWLAAVKEIRPKSVMIYTIARDTPLPGLEKASIDELKAIGKRIEALGIPVIISS